MSYEEYEWDPRPPNQQERIVAGVFLAVFTLANASFYFGWRLFGDYDGKVAAGLTLIGLALFIRYFPSVRRRQ